MKKKIFARLKTKAASFGFNRDELTGIAANIADNFDSEEATDEDIDAQIDAVMPLLKVGQQQAQRVIKASKTTPTANGNDDVDNNASVTEKNQKETDDNSKATPEWAKAMMQTIQTLSCEVTALKGDKVTHRRKDRLETMLKDTGKFGERTLKNFTKMKFENDEEFEEFLTDVQQDLDDYKQELGDETLSTVTKPVGGGDDKTKKEKPLTDKEVEDIVAGIS
ncbi:MAG: hypothetical protein LBV41_10940 [Cytophagaceae bacterium]|jgi:hypothetical protein|nr:hypothetical protein [Cytophagaceae bacterium]